MGNTQTEEANRPSHHVEGGTFRMPPEWGEFKFPATPDLLRFQYAMVTQKPEIPSYAELPLLDLNWKLINNPTQNNMIQYTWFGHSTFLCQIGGFNILTDPVFSERASPVQFAGPARIRPIPCTIEQLPPIDIIIISHNHYDHLDYSTVLQLYEHHKTATFYVPLKLKQWFIHCIPEIQNVIEMDWWETHTHKGIKQGQVDITFLPVQHWSLRSGTDRNCTLWGGWGLVYKPTDNSLQNRVLFHCGDTGYNEHCFKVIGERFSSINGGIDLAMIPIGAYEPRFVLYPQHVNPEESVIIAKEIQAKRSVGMHWGTFILTCEPIMEPKEKLQELVKNEEPNFFVTVAHGETVVMNDL
jgi:N-acyl-phosphatidylethanolamine-hydrolysing phospholipase D